MRRKWGGGLLRSPHGSAAEQLSRTCYGIEISPQYCDVVCRRWEQFTGYKATRVDADGNACEGMTELEAVND